MVEVDEDLWDRAGKQALARLNGKERDAVIKWAKYVKQEEKKIKKEAKQDAKI